ncbi:MAG: holo-ACP synthase [Anaerolineae bacterium]
MLLATGVDLIEIERLRRAIDRHGQRFLQRIFTPAELAANAEKIESLAGRFAAKEAVAKALGCGLGEIAWKEIEVLRGEKGEPRLVLHGAAALKARTLGLVNWSLSLSHSRDFALAFVVAANQ